MRSRFDEELALLHRELIEMGSLCEEVIALVTKALLTADLSLVKKVAALDQQIDQKERTVEAMCLRLLLQQQPVARDLRQISAALKMITDMERIGDQAQDIAELVMLLQGQRGESTDTLAQMAQATIHMVTDSVEAYVKTDLSLAKKVVQDDDIVDTFFTQERQLLIEAIAENPTQSEYAVDYLMIAKYYERIGDHAANIAEWVIFSVTGEHEGGD